MTTYYVDATTGSNSDTGLSEALAWQTLAKVSTFAGSTGFAPGDSILLKRGETWNEQFNISNVNGSSGNVITFGAYGSGALPIIDGGGVRTFAMKLDEGSYLVIEDIDCRNALFDNFRILCGTGNISNVTFQRCTSTSAGRHGFNVEATIASTDADDVYIRDCTATLSGNSGFVAYHVGSLLQTGTHFVNCLSTYSGQLIAGHGFSGYGGADSCDYVFFDSCEAAYTNIDPDTDLPNAFLTEGHGIVFDDRCHNSSIINCYSHDNEGSGIGLAHQSDLNTAAYNVVANNGEYGLFINGFPDSSDNCIVYNNTIYGNGGNGIQVNGPCAGLQIKNNIIANNTGWGISFAASGITGYTVATNIINSNTSGTTTFVTGATGTITSTPQFVSPSTSNFALLSTSPAIDTGLDLGVDYQMGLDPATIWPDAILTVDQDSQGGGWEIGAYVYYVTATVTGGIKQHTLWTPPGSLYYCESGPR